MKIRPLPFGVCRTHYYHPCDRAAKDPRKRHFCYFAYFGQGRSRVMKRFRVDELGETRARQAAIQWRASHGPLNYSAARASRRRTNQLRRLGRARAK